MKLLLSLFLLIGAVQGTPQVYDNLVHCLSKCGVPQVYPNTSTFTQTIIPYNIRLNFTPIAYTLPTTVPQVQAAVKCASGLGVKINPKSGGHSYASHDLGGEDGHLVVDLKYFHDVKVDPKTFVATIGPAARLGNVAIALFNQSGRALAHGLCPGVGIGGHVLHGGQGYSTHNAGLLLDSLVEAEIVTAEGNLVTASQTKNSDLFWALRGAGMSFGIVTSLKFQTFAAPAENILFYYPFVWTKPQARAGWDAWQNYSGGFTTPEIPLEMNVRLYITLYYPGYMVWLLEGAYHGSEADFLVAIAPLLNALSVVGGGVTADQTPGVGTHVLGWIDSLYYANNNDLLGPAYGSGERLETPLDYNVHSNFFAKSLMTQNLSPNGSDAWINALYTYGSSAPSPVEFFVLISAQGGPTSAVSKTPASSTSYAHRAAIYEWQLSSLVEPNVPVYPAAGIAWLNAFVGAIEASNEATGKLGMYYNYADPTLTTDEVGTRYWGVNYPRLKDVKRKWDAGRVFLNPQTVGV